MKKQTKKTTARKKPKVKKSAEKRTAKKAAKPSGSQKTREEKVLPDRGIFMWNYILNIDNIYLPEPLRSATKSRDITTACIVWLHQNLAIKAGFPIKLAKGGIGVIGNVKKSSDVQFEWVETDQIFTCPNYPKAECQTVLSCVRDASNKDTRTVCYSFLIEGKGYSTRTIQDLGEALSLYFIKFIEKNRPPKVEQSLVTRLGLNDANKALQCKAWPRLFKAIEHKEAPTKIYEAYLLDYLKRFKRLPFFHLNSDSFQDEEFMNQLCKCKRNKSQKFDPILLYIFLNWAHPDLRLYSMQDRELAEHIKKKFSEEVHPRTLAKRIERIGLTTDRPTGPRHL